MVHENQYLNFTEKRNFSKFYFLILSQSTSVSRVRGEGLLRAILPQPTASTLAFQHQRAPSMHVFVSGKTEALLI